MKEKGLHGPHDLNSLGRLRECRRRAPRFQFVKVVVHRIDPTSETEDLGLTAIPQQPNIGAEIDGIDLRKELSDDLRDQLRKLLLEYKVLFFRDQKLTRDQHIEFGRRFGNFDVHPLVQADEPLIQAISAERFRKKCGSREKLYQPLAFGRNLSYGASPRFHTARG
jgi:hypothetical protein